MNDHREQPKMKNTLLLKIIKGLFKISIKVLQFSLCILLGSSSSDEEVEEFREWQKKCDEYRRFLNHYKSF
jgi:hypothetical protein